MRLAALSGLTFIASTSLGLAACGSGDGGGDVTITGTPHTYVVDSITVPTDQNSANNLGFDLDGARKATSALPKDQVQRDLDATADYALTKIPAANGTLAVCGFCWGGGWAFSYAHMNSKLKAAYSFYGVAVDNETDAKNVACPVYGFYGQNDERVDATIPKGEELMKAAGKKYEPVIYNGAGHGFMRSGEPNNPDKREGDAKARDEAWARWKTLLKQL